MGTANNPTPRVENTDSVGLRLREEIRRAKFWQNIFLASIALLGSSLVVLILLAVIMKSNGLGVGAVFVGIVLVFLGIGGGIDYYERKDEILKRESQLRRRVETIGMLKRAAPENRRASYRAGLPDEIETNRINARKLRRIYNGLQVMVIFGSLSGSALVILSSEMAWLRYLAAINTIVVGVSATCATYFKFNERSLNHQLYADILESELRAADLRIGEYEGLDDHEALHRLVAQVESARSEHHAQERQLDQSSQVTLPTLPDPDARPATS